MKKGGKELQPRGSNWPVKFPRIRVYLCPPAAQTCRTELRRRRKSHKVRSVVQGFSPQSDLIRPNPVLKNILFLEPAQSPFPLFPPVKSIRVYPCQSVVQTSGDNKITKRTHFAFFNFARKQRRFRASPATSGRKTNPFNPIRSAFSAHA